MFPQQTDPEQSFDSRAIFLEVPETQPVTAASLRIRDAASATPAAKIKVRVNKPYRVVHGGKVFIGGQTLTIPDDVEHSRWLTAGWVTKAKGK